MKTREEIINMLEAKESHSAADVLCAKGMGICERELQDKDECILGNTWLENQFSLAHMYYKGKGTKKDLNESFRILSSLKNISDSVLLCLHPSIMEDGQVIRIRAAKQLEKLFPDRADSSPPKQQSGDDPETYYLRADYLYYARGLKEEALHYYRKAAEQGYEPAKREMDRTDPNWNQPAMPQPPAEQPIPPQTSSQEQPPTAEQLLREAHELLNSGETTKAADCAHRAAELGNAEAQYLYGKILSEGNDALKAMAAKWFRMAAEQGYNPSQAESPETQNDSVSQHFPKSLLRRLWNRLTGK